MDEKPKPKVSVNIKLPPVRTPHEWREITRAKLRAYEAIGFEIMGKKSKMGGGY